MKAPDLSGIEEGYQFIESDQGYFVFTINVSAENISNTFQHLAVHVEAPGFLVLEIPTHEDIEKEIRESESDPYHNDVFYLDGIDFNKAKAVIDPIENLLINDGMIHFGFGSHAGHDEVFIGPYKIFTIFAEEPGKYVAALKELGIPEVESLKTVWDNFTEDTPGQRFALDDVETTIYEIVDGLKEEGLYFAERRED